ncbi:hypothetical protein C2S52_021761 [Perilla frutescens var. hirtella]|nr:hypothetical protein C2S52_021761 [Perilla frutescens var. hirtella]
MTSSFNENEEFSFESLTNDKDCPKIGLEFDTEEDAYQFYLAYAKRVGFSIRRSKSHNDKFGKLVDRIFCCSAQGEMRPDKRDAYVQRARPQTRFRGDAKIKVSARRRNDGKFCVIQYVEEHNHYLSTPSKTHLHRSHMKIASSDALQIQMANDVGIPPKSSHALMARQVGGRENLGFIPQDYRNYLRSKRTKDVKSGILEDYAGKKPTTILTDQDAAMAKALASTWPETYHRLCIWHIYQNAAIHLSGVFSQFKDFAKDFGACVYDFEEEEEFIDAWNKMLSEYALEDNVWLRRLFGLKEKWALVYGRQIFCADMTTTQRSESMNSSLKKYVSYQHKFLEFFNHFQRLIDDRRYDEIRADFKSNITIPSLAYPVEILKYAATIYTPEAAESEDTYKMVKAGLLKMFEMVDERLQNGKSKVQQSKSTNSEPLPIATNSGPFLSSNSEAQQAQQLPNLSYMMTNNCEQSNDYHYGT